MANEYSKDVTDSDLIQHLQSVLDNGPSIVADSDETETGIDDIELPCTRLTKKRSRRKRDIKKRAKLLANTSVGVRVATLPETGPPFQPSPPATCEYGCAIFKMWVGGDFTDLQILLNTILKPECVLNVRSIRKDKPLFADKRVPGNQIYNFFVACSDSMPDAVLTSLSAKQTKHGLKRTVVTAFRLNGTHIQNDAAAFRETFILPEQINIQDNEILPRQQLSMTLTFCGSLVLTLDEDAKVELMDIVYYFE